LLLGETGAGKSRIGNKLFNRNCFVSCSGYNSITKVGSMVHQVITVGNKQIPLSIVDTVGVGDTELNWNDQKVNIANSLSLCPNGFDIVLLVVKKGRFNQSIIQSWKLLFQQLLGESAYAHCYVALTHCRHTNRQEHLNELHASKSNELVSIMLDKIGEKRIVFLELGNEETDRSALSDSREFQNMNVSIEMLKQLILNHPQWQRYLTETMKRTIREYTEQQRRIEEERRKREEDERRKREAQLHAERERLKAQQEMERQKCAQRERERQEAIAKAQQDLLRLQTRYHRYCNICRKNVATVNGGNINIMSGVTTSGSIPGPPDALKCTHHPGNTITVPF